MRQAMMWLMLACSVQAAAPAGAQGRREVNITQGSEAGWIPSVELEAQARATAEVFLEAVDRGKDEAAYAMMTAAARAHIPFAQFTEGNRIFREKGKALIKRRLVKVTWTRTPDRPGTFAAIDLQSQYANIDRQCGYVVLVLPPLSGVFEVVRVENNFLDNETAKGIAAAELEKLWAQLSANCPNFEK